jgi:2-dehydropantoate 2-reductase
MLRIGILGIGGVGGYFGGLLAEKYTGSGNTEIVFIARPPTAKIINEKGLRLITPEAERIIFPDLVSSDSKEIGLLDYLVCTTKSYDLEEGVASIKDCIHANTIVLPLLNGVDAKERISRICPDAIVIDGCVYIVSYIKEAGVIEKTGNIHKLYFGSDTAPANRMKELEKIFLDAGIDCILSGNIQTTVWEKFIFISPLASLTSYADLSIGEIRTNDTYNAKLLLLIEELKSIADAKGIRLPENIIDLTLKKIAKLPHEATSSMHRDFKKGGKTEYRSLTAYAADNGKKLNIATPEFDMILEEFKSREIINPLPSQTP